VTTACGGWAAGAAAAGAGGAACAGTADDDTMLKLDRAPGVCELAAAAGGAALTTALC